jgi:5-formyltetrahydrofolate cyclo-ligase
MGELLSAKRAIRERVLDQRANLTEQQRAEKSAAICTAIAGIQEFASAKSILFFMPFRGEVDIVPLLNHALERGCTCALPKCGKDRSLKLFAISDLDRDISPGKWEIPEPKDCLSEYTCDDFSVIIVPGVAFDRQGRRVGYGAGYYDRLLSAGRDVLKVAPAYAFQVVSELPHEQHDVPVDIIVTEEEIIDCR